MSGAVGGDRRVAVVTGASGGIGAVIAERLAASGFHVVLVGRNVGRLEAVSERIGSRIPGASLERAVADLSLLVATRRLGEALAGAHQRISLLVNNAGVFATRRSLTPEGRELVLATNHLSPFVLTGALAGALAAAGGARIVNVGSVISEFARIDPDDLELESGWNAARAYARSKLALTMATFDWSERLAAAGVSVNVVHPGSVATGIVRDGGISALTWRLARPFLLSVEQGAEGPLHAALSDRMRGVSGRYLRRTRLARPNRQALDPRLRAAVASATRRLVDRS